MMGTLATALAGRKIPTHTDRYEAHVEGDIEDVDGVLRISRIRVAYRLKVPAGKGDEAREVFSTYVKSCPAAMSVCGCIDIQDSLEITEIERGPSPA
jgi:organic hydroperoxide reductase OsmC/OhrA